MPQTLEQKKKYESYIDLLSVINGKVIDAAKTGVIFKIPIFIAKYGKPVPYFMKYASAYYAKQKKFLKSQSNMNRLCWDIERWEKNIKWQKRDKNFNYNIMIDEGVVCDQNIFDALENTYLAFNKDIKQMKKDELSIQRELGGADTFKLKWDEFYDRYRKQCFATCPDKKMLVNALVKLCYESYPKGTTGFLWNMAGEFIADNIKQVSIALPKRSQDNSEFEYFGKGFRMSAVNTPQLEDLAEFYTNENKFEWVSD